MNATPRTLSRSLNDRMIAGVMGGIAHRFGRSEERRVGKECPV